MQQFPASDTPQVYHISLLYKSCGKRWDLPKFVDVLSVNLGFSQSLICWVSWSIQQKIYRMPSNKVTDHETTECHLTNCTGSTLDPTKFNHWQLQNVLRIYVGRNFGWHRPNYKMSLVMLAIPIFSYFLTSDALDFVVLILNYFPSQKELCSSFCSCKKSNMHCIV